MPCGIKTAIKKAIQNQMEPWQSAIQNFICISRNRHLAILPGCPGNRQLGIIYVFVGNRQLGVEFPGHRQQAILFGFQPTRSFLFWIVGQPTVRKLSALAVWFGFQGNRQLGIYVDFEQSALGNSILISGQSSTGKFTWISSNWQLGIILIFVWRQSAVGNFIWILGNQQLGF